EVINSATLFIRTMRLSSMGAVTHGTLSCGCPTSSSPLPNASMHRLKYRAPGITQEVEPVRPCVAQPGLGPVQGQSKTRHHPVRPRQSLSRVTTAEDDEVVGIIDDMC